ncbi:MAG: purine-nucleoside phosphorylase [Myxococcota bacterium]
MANINRLTQDLENARTAVRKHTDKACDVALVLGSGLGAFADELESRVAIPYEEIPGIPISAVKGHAGNLVFGNAGKTRCVAMQGRVHLYEGHSAYDVVFGVRLMASLGAKSLLITNAAGGVDPTMRPGDLMLIEDHLNLTGTNCLVGPNDDSIGPRFPDMTEAYDRKLMGLADNAAAELGFELRRGVYAGLLGPTYETPAEVRMVRAIGGTAVGMSTVLEVIAARHMGVRVLGISCITNQAAGIGGQALSHDEVKDTAEQVRDRFVGLVRSTLEKMAA